MLSHVSAVFFAVTSYSCKVNTKGFVILLQLRQVILHVHVRYMSSPVRLSVVRLLSVRAPFTQAIELFGNVSTPFGTLAIC